MIERVAHRINEIPRLETLSSDLGAEIDIRSAAGELILHHEPHAAGPKLDDFLRTYARTRKGRLLILNPKEDGLDGEILALAHRHGLENFFLLDLPYPSIVRLAVREGERRVAVRFSEFETAESALRLAGKAAWVWVDCFDGKPPEAAQVRELRQAFRVCLVSPELAGHGAERIPDFLPLAKEADAVCTKYPERWSS